jgi:steroid delta-isomerase-like uncharacterized protein
MPDQTKAMVQRLYDEGINGGKLELFDELLAEDVVEHEELPGFSSDRDGVKQFFEMLTGAFDGFKMDVEGIVADGDMASARVTMRGTHSGEFMGIPASGKTVAVPVADFFRVNDDGKVAEHWGVIDNLAMMQQLGVIPEEPPPV